MTKMAAMPIYGKNLKKSSSLEPKADDLETWCASSGARVLPDCSNDDPGLTLTYFTARSIWSLMLLYGKKVKQWIFQKLLSSMI